MNTWIIPCNISVFNIIEHFSNNTEILWKGTSSTAVGDVVYLYVGTPYSEIRYRCTVVETNLTWEAICESPYEILKRPSKMRKNYIRLRLDFILEQGLVPLSRIKEAGQASVQSQMRTTKELENIVEAIVSSKNG